jgi:uncharacterized repeat protein (TIGR03803 family)
MRTGFLLPILCLLFSQSPAIAEGAELIYVPQKGDGWKASGGAVEWNGALVSSLQSSPKGYRFNRAQRGCGVIFRLAGGKAETLYDFSTHPYARGCRVGAELTVHGGDIYGVTWQGGNDDNGTIFRLTSQGVHRVVHRFAGRDGRTPAGGLVRGLDGQLYGVTQYGGLYEHGTVYRLGKTGRLTTLHHFRSGDPLGEFPSEGLTMGPDGAVYGVAEYGTHGGGTIFRISEDGQVALVKALSATDGCWPSKLTTGQDGWLYGSAFRCGDRDMGTLYRLHPDGAFERLHSFSGDDGIAPNFALTQSRDGTWYGVTAGDDPSSSVVFRTRFDSQGVTVLHRFDSAEAGLGPSGPLLLASDGYLYGTSANGGNEKGFLGTGPGTVFRLVP